MPWPVSACTSLWQTPDATTRRKTSPIPGVSISTSSIVGVPGIVSSTAARMPAACHADPTGARDTQVRHRCSGSASAGAGTCATHEKVGGYG